MSYLTDRKRATGLGSSKSGTAHHWQMMIGSTALIILVPLFVYVLGSAIGLAYEDAIAHFARPFNAIVTGLTITVGLIHFRHGVQIMLEDYVHGHTRTYLIAGAACLSYGLIAVALFALARIAL